MGHLSLSRREFIKIGAIILASAKLAEAKPTKKRIIISIDEAVSNPAIRQQYIDQLVEKEPCPKASLINYDHDYLKFLEVSMNYGEQVSGLNLNLSEIGVANKEEFLELIRSTPEFMKELSNAISQTDIVKAGAISIHYLFERHIK